MKQSCQSARKDTKELQHLKYNKDMLIFQPDKGSSLVFLNHAHYVRNIKDIL